MNILADNNFIENAVRQYSDTVLRIAFQYTRNKPDAEDVLQDVFIALMKQPPFTSSEHLKAWLIRVTINKSKDYLRANKRRNAAVLQYKEYGIPEEFNEVAAALSKLSEPDRDALYLHYYEGYKAREIASMLGTNERTVTKRLGRAREKLKKYLEDLEE